MNEIRLIPADDITLDPRLQMRAKMDEDAIDEYAARIDSLPPCKVVLDEEGKYYLTDGWHSYYAHQKAQKTEIPCTVRQGTFRDAILEAAGANSEHGLRRTPADKRKAVKAVLSDPEWFATSDRWVADTCKVSHSFVSDCRAEMEVERKASERKRSGGRESTSEESDKRKGRDGKTYDAKRETAKREEPDKSKWCDRCRRIGVQTVNCQICLSGREEKKTEQKEEERADERQQEKPKPKPGTMKFDDKKIPEAVGKLARLFNERANALGLQKSPKYAAVRTKMDELLEAWEDWQKS